MPYPYDQTNQMDPMFDPRTQMLLGMGAGMLQATGPSKRPVSLGQAMGHGLEQGMLSSSNALTQQMKLQEMRAMEQYRQAQAEEMRQRSQQHAEELRVKQKQAQTQQQIIAWIAERDPELAKWVALHPESAGEVVKAIVAQPKQPKLERIETTNASGGRIQKFVEPTAGAEFPVAPKEFAPATSVSVNTGDRRTFQDESALRKEYDTTMKDVQEARNAFVVVRDSAQAATPAGDLAAATKFMKILDPSSVVRESELAMAMQASGAYDRLVNYHKRLINGEKLTPDQRADFLNIGRTLYEGLASQQSGVDDYYRKLSQDYGFNPERIVRRGNKSVLGGTGGKDAPLPLPQKGKALLKNTWYQTSHGPAKWDGMRFVTE